MPLDFGPNMASFVSAIIFKSLFLKSRDLLMYRGHYMRRSRDLPGDSLSCTSFRSMNSSVLKLRPCCSIWRRFSSTSIEYAQCIQNRPRRAVMYVPGTDQRKMEKVRSLNVDSAVLDLEDGVALNQKVGCSGHCSVEPVYSSHCTS